MLAVTVKGQQLYYPKHFFYYSVQQCSINVLPLF